MTGFAYDPTEPLPKRWIGKNGLIRLLCQPHEGYIMARSSGAMPFVLSVRDLLGGEYEPVVRKSVRASLSSGGDTK